MTNLLWLTLQVLIIGFFVWVGVTDPDEPNLKGGLLAGVMFAFIATIAIVIVREQWLLWSRKVREWRAHRQSPPASIPRSRSRWITASRGAPRLSASRASSKRVEG